MISDRPFDPADRDVPGNWEGDLIMGTQNRSAIATLVERSTRYVMLIHLAGNHRARALRDGLTQAFAGLPASMAKSLTWDQGTEISLHAEFTATSGVPVYFCEPRLPWQRGTNENTNGLRDHSTAPAILPQPDQSCPSLSRATGRCGRRTQRQTPSNPGRRHTSPPFAKLLNTRP
jgi:IS30 family transposase